MCGTQARREPAAHATHEGGRHHSAASRHRHSCRATDLAVKRRYKKPSTVPYYTNVSHISSALIDFSMEGAQSPSGSNKARTGPKLPHRAFRAS
eukprot:1281640-Pleurochrysis_carterae.AAC.2